MLTLAQLPRGNVPLNAQLPPAGMLRIVIQSERPRARAIDDLLKARPETGLTA